MIKNKYFKAHSIGNNFILVITSKLDSIDSDFVLKYNNHFFGIGCNQLLVVDQNNNVRIWDEDGTIARLCGNGLRCLAKLLNKPNIILNSEFTGFIELKNLKNDLVSMKLKYAPIISFHKDYYLVDVGNLNKIFFVEDNSIINIDSFANNEFNVSFISKKNNQWNIRTIESCTKHETFACGSAALASAYALKYKGETDFTLHFRLGSISHNFEDNTMVQIGPAKVLAEFFIN